MYKHICIVVFSGRFVLEKVEQLSATRDVAGLMVDDRNRLKVVALFLRFVNDDVTYPDSSFPGFLYNPSPLYSQK